MADSRIRNTPLTTTAAELASVLASAYIAIDQTAWTDAKKMALNEFFHSAIVTDGTITAKALTPKGFYDSFIAALTSAIVATNTDTTHALTPKGFYDSVMTTTRKGIGQLSTDEAVTAKTGTGLLNATHQTLMQTQWKKDFRQGTSIITGVDNDASPNAMTFECNWSGNLANGANIKLSPNFNGKHIKLLQYSSCITAEAGNKPSSLFGYMSGSGALINANTGNLYLLIASDSSFFGLYCAGSLGTNIRASISCRVTLV